MTSKEVIAKAKNEVGTKESPANSNNVKYNTWYYGKPVSGAAYPWCCTFVSWLFQNEQQLCLKTASCATLYDWFASRGQIVNDPQPGDIPFFKYKTNNRKTNHTGIVTDLLGKNVKTVEGNTSVTSNDNGGSVMERVRTLNNIIGFGRPKYSDIPKVALTNRPILSLGSKGPEVTYLQLRLQVFNYDVGLADGDFGNKTLVAVKKFQIDHKLTPDGIVGPKTWAQIG